MIDNFNEMIKDFIKLLISLIFYSPVQVINPGDPCDSLATSVDR